MNNLLPPPFSRDALFVRDRAVLAAAVIAAVALLSSFIQVLDEQVQRGQSLRAQFAAVGCAAVDARPAHAGATSTAVASTLHPPVSNTGLPPCLP